MPASSAPCVHHRRGLRGRRPRPTAAERTVDGHQGERGARLRLHQLVAAGPLKGFLVANSQINLGADPTPLLAPPAAPVPVDTAQITALQAAATAKNTALDAAILSEKPHVDLSATLKAARAK